MDLVHVDKVRSNRHAVSSEPKCKEFVRLNRQAVTRRVGAKSLDVRILLFRFLGGLVSGEDAQPIQTEEVAGLENPLKFGNQSKEEYT